MSTNPPVDRVPPHNLEAEQSVLGSMLLERDAIARVVELVRPEDFYRDAHRRIFETIERINKEGTTILLVEQNALMALQVAHRGYVIQTGQIVLTDTAQALRQNEMVQHAYLGIG